MAGARNKQSAQAPGSSDGGSVQSTRRPSRQPPVPAGWTPRITGAEQIPELLARLPDDPGVYIMRDREGHVVYVGKARRLRTRVRQYFSGHDTRAFVPLLTKLLGDLETIVVANNKEALLLENNLIKEHRPRFNVKLRDDSSYLVLRLDPRSDWPKLELVRGMGTDGAHYFGPYHSAGSARQTLRVVNRHFQLRTCTDFALHHRKRPCLQYQIDRCPAPCVFEIDGLEYENQVTDVSLFLSGKHRDLVRSLTGRMHDAAAALEFEVAARLRDQLGAVETTLQSQQVVGTGTACQDAIGMMRQGGQVEFAVLHVRQGKLLGTQSFSATGMELPDAEVLANFVTIYYQKAPFFPDEVLLPAAIADDDALPLAAWMRDRKGKKVALSVPERGDRKKLTELAQRNAASNFATRRDPRQDSDAVLLRLKTRLGLSRVPRTIECYDVSHIQGSDPVASMVVFVDGVPAKSRYRSFKIKGIGVGDEGTGLSQGSRQNDDFASMYEVLGRRIRRALQDSDDWQLPDLLVIDGGKGQLSRVVAALQDLGVGLGAEGVDVIALAKERRGLAAPGPQRLQALKRSRANAAADARPGAAWEDNVLSRVRQDDQRAGPPEGSGKLDPVKPERVFVPGAKEAIRLRAGSSERYLLERMRDEAHRFAITHHRKRRAKRSIKSALDDIEGVGPALKRALVQHFGSVGAIRKADVDALTQVKGIGRALAERIVAQC